MLFDPIYNKIFSQIYQSFIEGKDNLITPDIFDCLENFKKKKKELEDYLVQNASKFITILTEDDKFAKFQNRIPALMNLVS